MKGRSTFCRKTCGICRFGGGHCIAHFALNASTRRFGVRTDEKHFSRLCALSPPVRGQSPLDGSPSEGYLPHRFHIQCERGGMADALDSGSSEVTLVEVQVLSLAPTSHKTHHALRGFESGGSSAKMALPSNPISVGLVRMAAPSKMCRASRRSHTLNGQQICRQIALLCRR